LIFQCSSGFEYSLYDFRDNNENSKGTDKKTKQETALLLKVSENVEGQQKMIGCMPMLYENANIAYLR